MAVRRLLALALALVFVAQFSVVFVRPLQRGGVAKADAVVVLSGDHGDRLDLGLSLVRRGVAPRLVILRPTDGPFAISGSLCSDPQEFEVRCVDPDLVSTIGDVRAVKEMAKGAGWTRVVVVTTSFHVTRSRVILARCSDVDVDVRSSRRDFPLRVWARIVVHEAGGLAQALFLLRC